jgi:ubiquinone/menaquinone biosynthesis C-methylase UbiE
VGYDAAEFRRGSLDRWGRAARGWGKHRAVFQAGARPVSGWLVDAIEPQPGHRVLELAAGPGDTGLLAAELVAPGGTLVSTDAAPEMVELARARAAELGIANAEFRTMDAEWIDLPTASVDGVIGRWVYMLLADPASALREARRVLRPGGRIALAAWAAPADNPWAAVAQEELAATGVLPPPDPREPGMFGFRDADKIRELLDDAGFTDVAVEQLDLVWRYEDLDAWWDVQIDISPGLNNGVAALTPAARDDLRDAIDARLAPYVAPDGSVALPGRTHVAAASA